jgi:hypothetical protein
MKLITFRIKEKFFHPIPFFGQFVALVNQADVESGIRKTKAYRHSKNSKLKKNAFSKTIKIKDKKH